MGKREKEHRKKVQARKQRLTDSFNRQKKFFAETRKVQEQMYKEYQMAQLIQKNIDDVMEKSPDLFIKNEDGTYQYNTELVSINEKDEVVLKAGGIPVFETYNDKKITSVQYLEIIKDLVEYGNTVKAEVPEIVIDEPLQTVPESDSIVIESVKAEELPN